MAMATELGRMLDDFNDVTSSAVGLLKITSRCRFHRGHARNINRSEVRTASVRTNRHRFSDGRLYEVDQSHYRRRDPYLERS